MTATLKRIFVDFNTLTSAPEDVAKFSERFTPPDMDLHNGERVILSDGELEVEAILQHSDHTENWLATPIPGTWRDVESPTPSVEELLRWSADYDRQHVQEQHQARR